MPNIWFQGVDLGHCIRFVGDKATALESNKKRGNEGTEQTYESEVGNKLSRRCIILSYQPRPRREGNEM